LRVTPDTTSAVAESMVGRCIDGRYQLEAEIGVGGLGSVYRAQHTKLQRAVAVKLLHESCGSDVLQRRRFEREAKALAALEHPNIVAILDYGVSENRPYLVMELLEGETLAQRLKRGPIPIKPALSIAQQLLEALSFMHGAGLVHRDVKPSNVFLQRLLNGRERVKVLDFGLAKFTAPTVTGSDPTLTRDGTIVGTPAYMSPEQATGDMVDARGDVYAVGVIVFQMLSGRLPFEGDAIELIRSHLVATVPMLERMRPDREIDAALDALIQRAMAKRREERFANAAEMLRGLLGIAPAGLDPQLPDRESISMALAEVDALTGDLLIALDDSNDVPTAVRTGQSHESKQSKEPKQPKQPKDGVIARSVGWMRKGVRRLLVASVRVVAGVSMLLVLTTVAIIALLFRSDADRADLVALQRRVSDRFVQRSFRGNQPSEAASRHMPNDAPGSGNGQGTDSLAVPRVATPPPPAEPAPMASPDGSALALQHAPADDPAAAVRPEAADQAPPASTGAVVANGEPSAPEVVAGARPEPFATATATATAPEPSPPMAAIANEALVPEGVPGPPPARNPWIASLPRELRLVHKLVSNGGRVGERSALALRTYNQEHLDDPRGHLLLGQLYMNRLWRPDALAQFSAALQLDLSARGAPEVLPALLELVIQGKVANQAEKLIIKSYGSEALSAVDEAIAKLKDPSALARLQALRLRLGT
jgi:serine/threonine protein kinase